VHELSYIDQSAILIGEVVVEKNAVILPGVVLRADEWSPIVIGEGSNVQDGVIMHGLKGSRIDIGKRCSIAHGAVVHGPCRIGDDSFVGFNAVLLKAILCKNCFVSHGAMVLGVEIPDGKFVPAGQVIDHHEKVASLADLSGEMKEFTREVLEVNGELLRGYRRMAVRSILGDVHEEGQHLSVINE